MTFLKEMAPAVSIRFFQLGKTCPKQDRVCVQDSNMNSQLITFKKSLRYCHSLSISWITAYPNEKTTTYICMILGFYEASYTTFVVFLDPIQNQDKATDYL